MVSASDIYREEKAAIEKEFKDDPEMFKWRMDELEDWYKTGDWDRIV
jgi:hypothetical protein